MIGAVQAGLLAGETYLTTYFSETFSKNNVALETRIADTGGQWVKNSGAGGIDTWDTGGYCHPTSIGSYTQTSIKPFSASYAIRIPRGHTNTLIAGIGSKFRVSTIMTGMNDNNVDQIVQCFAGDSVAGGLLFVTGTDYLRTAILFDGQTLGSFRDGSSVHIVVFEGIYTGTALKWAAKINNMNTVTGTITNALNVRGRKDIRIGFTLGTNQTYRIYPLQVNGPSAFTLF